MSVDFYHFILPQILYDDGRKWRRKEALNDSLHILFLKVQHFYMVTVFKCKTCAWFLFSLSFLFFNPCLESLSSQHGETELKFLHQSPLSHQYVHPFVLPPLLTLAITCCFYLYSVVLQLTYTKYKVGIVWRIALSICNLWDTWKCTYAWK